MFDPTVKVKGAKYIETYSVDEEIYYSVAFIPFTTHYMLRFYGVGFMLLLQLRTDN